MGDPATDGEERTILQLKVCSARKLVSPSNAYVHIEFGGWSRQTTVKKHTQRPIWNETFVFPVDESIETFSVCLKNRDALGKVIVLGKTRVLLPQKVNDLMDTWVVLDETSTDVHLCVQLEPIAGRSLDLLLNNHGNSSRSSLLRFGTSSFRLLGSFSAATGSGDNTGRDKSTTGEEKASDFGVRAGAVTLNEICQALDRLRCVVYLAGVDKQADMEGVDMIEQRHIALQAAKVELDELADQIEEVDGLSDEWKEKLSLLVEDYSKDCWKMLSDESWANLASKRKSRPAPPLPSKETREKIRQDRLQSAVADSVTPPLPSVPPPRPPASSPPPPSEAKMPPMQPSLEEHEVVIREHFLSSLDSFDEMMDFGFAVEFPQGKGRGKCAVTGDVVKCRLTAFVIDGAIGKAVSYDSSPSEVLFVLGETHEDVPRGLMGAMHKIPNQQPLALVTVTPQWGFGDDGHPKGVPPNSCLLFEVRNVHITTPLAAPIQSAEPFVVPLVASPDSSLSKMFGTFPPREDAVLLTAATPPPRPLPPQSASATSAVASTQTKRRSLLRSFSTSAKDSVVQAESEKLTRKSPLLPASSASSKSSPPASPPSPPTRQKSERLVLAELNVRLSRRAVSAEAQRQAEDEEML